MSTKDPQPLDAKPEASLQELTFRGIVLGALITVLFTSSNVYLGLKVGLTFSSSIPATVISMAVLGFFAGSNILENNMVQTQASAAGTLSAVIFVLPSILMVGYWTGFPFWQTFLICGAGGVLGVLFSIPLRRTMVVGSDLPYPEGVAAAEVLRAGHESHAKGGASHILHGAIWSGVLCFLSSGMRLFTDKMSLWFSFGKSISQIPMGFSLALLSAGYLMGFQAGIAVLIGLVLSWGVFVPFLTAGLAEHAGTLAETAMQVWDSKVRFIGAGALAVAAVWTMLTLLKPMAVGIRMSFKSLQRASSGAAIDRREQDLSMRSLVIIGLVMFVAMIVVVHYFIRHAGIEPAGAWVLVVTSALLIFIIGFFVASACGYMAGLIGSSNSPISGIGLIGVMVVSLVLMGVDSMLHVLVGPEGQKFGMALALFTATGVVSVASIANDNLQDLKTGQLVGATPKNQQIALLIGCVVGALVIAPILSLLYHAYGFSGAPLPRPEMATTDLLSAPQATLMASIAKGIFTRSLDWSMFLTGMVVGAVVIAFDLWLKNSGKALRISALAVGLGIYLPPYTNTAIVVGAILSLIVQNRLTAKDRANGTNELATNSNGTLVASGFIVGESMIGVLVALAVLVSMGMGYGDAPFDVTAMMTRLLGDSFASIRTVLSAAAFVLGALFLYRRATR